MSLITVPSGVGSGGGLTPTTLWSNDSPTSNFPTSGTTKTVTLSDDIDNYEYIKIRVRRNVTKADEYSVIYSVEDFKKLNTASADSFIGAVGHYNTAASHTVRQFYCVSNTSVTFEIAYAVNSTGSSASAEIPIEIIGLK